MILKRITSKLNIKYVLYFLLIPIGYLNPTLNWIVIIFGPLLIYKKQQGVLLSNQKKYFKSLLLFLFVVILSGVISVDLQYPLKIALNITSIIIASFFFTLNIQSKKELIKLINSVIFASLLYSLILYPVAFKNFTFNFVESETFGKNSSSLIILVGLAANMLRIRLTKSDLISEIINYFFYVTIFFTGSIKVILTSTFLLFAFLFLKGGFQFKKIVLSIIILTLFGFIVSLFIERFNPFEDQSFLRITSRISVLFGGESEIGYIDSDYMTKYRGSLINQGLEIFYLNPLIGIGMENTRLFLGTYTHNNFVEILAGSGVIGFSFYIYTILIIIKSTLRVKDKGVKLILLSSLLCFLLIANAQRIYDNRFLMVFLVSYLPMYRILNNEKK